MSSVTSLFHANDEENPMTRFSAHKFFRKIIKGPFVFIYVFKATAQTSAKLSESQSLSCYLASVAIFGRQRIRDFKKSGSLGERE